MVDEYVRPELRAAEFFAASVKHFARRGACALRPTGSPPEASAARRLRLAGVMTDRDDEWLRRALKGDAAARARVLADHERNLRWVVKSVVPQGGSREDYMQEARLGLLRAMRTFDPDRGVRFWTYARYWVRVFVTEYWWRNRSIVKCGETRASRLVRSGLASVERQLGPEVDDATVARTLQVPIEDVTRVRSRLRGADSSTASFQESLPSPDRDTHDLVCDRIEGRRQRQSVQQLLAGLGKRDRDIVRRRLMLEPPETLEAIGRRYGISRERVRQLEQRALERMRTTLEGGETGQRQVPSMPV